MASATDSGPVFFTKATPEQWTYVFSQYKEVLKEKASLRTKKGGPEELIRLDTWYQEQLPKIIQTRKPAFIKHEELVQIVKWKLMRGKFRPRLTDLVRINTETAVFNASKKAFRKPPKDLSNAITSLTNLKGVGPATASAILTAAFPNEVPYMADESMLSTPGIEATDYTLAEYLNYAEHIKACSDRLAALDPKSNWTPHKIELTLWTHYIARDLKPSIFDDFPEAKPVSSENGENHSEEDNQTIHGANGNHVASEEPQVVVPKVPTDEDLPSEENTNDSHADSGKENVGEIVDVVDDEASNAAAPEEKSQQSDDQPPAKKICLEQ